MVTHSPPERAGRAVPTLRFVEMPSTAAVAFAQGTISSCHLITENSLTNNLYIFLTNNLYIFLPLLKKSLQHHYLWALWGFQGGGGCRCSISQHSGWTTDHHCTSPPASKWPRALQTPCLHRASRNGGIHAQHSLCPSRAPRRSKRRAARESHFPCRAPGPPNPRY